MKINRDQYEIWFLDYLEGNLDASGIDDFRSFLEENPDLAEELEFFEPVPLSPPEMVFPHRKKLYKQPFDQQELFDETAIGMLEGDLTPENLNSFEKYLKEHPEKFQEMELFRQTKLNPEPEIVYHHKRRLYHSVRRLTISPSVLLKIAALLLLALILPVIGERNSPLPLQTTEPQVFSSINQNDTETVPEEMPVVGSAIASTVLPSRKVNNRLPVITVEKKKESNLVQEEQPILAAVRNELPALLPAEAHSDPYLVKTGDPSLMFSSAALEMLAQNDTGEQYLSDKLAQKMGLSGFNMGKVVRWGLTIASGLSKGKFNYSTSESGDIIALNLDTRLVGFSIPVNEK